MTAGQGDANEETAAGALTVCACTTYGTDATGATVIGWHEDKASGEHIPAQPSDWRQSAALSMTATSTHDIRPRLLALVSWQNMRELEPCITYGRRYLAAWCERMGGRTHRPDILTVAATDALAAVYAGRMTRGGKRVTIEARAKELRVDSGAFGAMRKHMVEVYGWRLTEAVKRYTAANNYRPIKSGQFHGNGFRDDPPWKHAHAKPEPVKRTDYLYSPTLEIRGFTTAIENPPSRAVSRNAR